LVGGKKKPGKAGPGNPNKNTNKNPKPTHSTVGAIPRMRGAGGLFLIQARGSRKRGNSWFPKGRGSRAGGASLGKREGPKKKPGGRREKTGPFEGFLSLSFFKHSFSGRGGGNRGGPRGPTQGGCEAFFFGGPPKGGPASHCRPRGRLLSQAGETFAGPKAKNLFGGPEARDVRAGVVPNPRGPVRRRGGGGGGEGTRSEAHPGGGGIRPGGAAYRGPGAGGATKKKNILWGGPFSAGVFPPPRARGGEFFRDHRGPPWHPTTKSTHPRAKEGKPALWPQTPFRAPRGGGRRK